MFARRRIGMTITLALVLAGCNGGPKQELEKLLGTATAEADTTYRLDLQILGLSTFVEDGGGVWVLMPKTTYNPNSPLDADLPPGVLAEIKAAPSKPTSAQIAQTLVNDYPTHTPKLRLTNATVTQGGKTLKDPEIPLMGADLRFLDLPPSFQKPDFHLLVDAQHVLATNPNEPPLSQAQQKELRNLDKVDPALLGAGLDSRLAARARIDFGRLVGQENSSCPGRLFTFRNPPQPPGCTPGPAMTLAEEVVGSIDKLTQGFRIQLSASDPPLAVEPTDRGKPLLVQILDQVEGMSVDCSDSLDHPKAFRWYYRLGTVIPATADPQFFPCLKVVGKGTFGGNKCPLRQMAAK